jgi:TatD DNase family protein
MTKSKTALWDQKISEIKQIVSRWQLIDTHCHLDSLKREPLDQIISDSINRGVEKMITIAADIDQLDSVLEIALKYPNVFCSQGIHPHSSKNFNSEVLEKIRSHAQNEKFKHKIKAIGEIGLDYYYEFSDPKVQKEVFFEQLDLAQQLNLPVVIHTRDAEDDTFDILNNSQFKNNENPLKGVIHSFTSSLSLARKLLDLGFYIGINGIVTFKNAAHIQELVKFVPDDRMLIETDAPYLTPVPLRGVENSPQFLPYVLLKILEIKLGDDFLLKNNHQSEMQKLINQLYQNSQDLFAI